MTDNQREILSAFIDGEASEIEIHRLLRQDDDGARSWGRYQQIRAVIRGEAVLSVDRHDALRDSIRQSIEREEVLGEMPRLGTWRAMSRSATTTYAKPAAAFGLAASLLVAVMVGFNMNRDIDGSSESGAPATFAERAESTGNAAGPEAASSRRGNNVIAAQTVAGGNAGRNTMDAENELELRELDKETLQAVRAYLNQHDRSVRMQPVIYSNQPEGN